MAAPMKKNDGIDLLYPDLLSKEGLLHNLRKRFIKISPIDLEELDKEALVELYNKYILPLPQRKYRDNLRGREMKKRQIIKDKKRKFTLRDDEASSAKKERLSLEESPSGPTTGLVNQFNLSSTGSRLKPPPSCIDTNKKVIKLGASSSSSSPTKQSDVSTTPSPTSKKVIKLSSPLTAPSPTQPSGASTTPSPTSKKLIKLNSGAKSNDVATKRPADEAKEEGEKSPKKKFNAISWP